jgi:hypothetical protein
LATDKALVPGRIGLSWRSVRDLGVTGTCAKKRKKNEKRVRKKKRKEKGKKDRRARICIDFQHRLPATAQLQTAHSLHFDILCSTDLQNNVQNRCVCTLAGLPADTETSLRIRPRFFAVLYIAQLAALWLTIRPHTQLQASVQRRCAKSPQGTQFS